MEYRSTDAIGFSHFGGVVVAGVNSTVAVELSSNTIKPVGDGSNYDLVLKGKGTGGVYLNGSTTPWKVVAGESTMTAPDMAANSQAEATLAAANISTGDIILQVDFRNTLSTSYLPGLPYVGAAGKIHVPLANCHVSTISASTGVTVRWLYLDRT